MFSLLISACVIFVYYDATKNKIGKISDEKGFLNMKAGWWAVFTMLLWIVGFPLYLIKRKKLLEKAKKSPQEPSSWRKIWLGFFIFLFLMNILFILLMPMIMRIVVQKYVAPAIEESVTNMMPTVKKAAPKKTVSKKATPKKATPKKVISTKTARIKAGAAKKAVLRPASPDSKALRASEIAADIRILKSSKRWVNRNEAARRLAGVTDNNAINALILALAEDLDPFVRREAALSLGKSGDMRARSPLKAALEDQNYWVREFAAQALKGLK